MLRRLAGVVLVVGFLLGPPGRAFFWCHAMAAPMASCCCESPEAPDDGAATLSHSCCERRFESRDLLPMAAHPEVSAPAPLPTAFPPSVPPTVPSDARHARVVWERPSEPRPPPLEPSCARLATWVI